MWLGRNRPEEVRRWIARSDYKLLGFLQGVMRRLYSPSNTQYWSVPHLRSSNHSGKVGFQKLCYSLPSDIDRLLKLVCCPTVPTTQTEYNHVQCLF
jgi:hypothetical protein